MESEMLTKIADIKPEKFVPISELREFYGLTDAQVSVTKVTCGLDKPTMCGKMIVKSEITIRKVMLPPLRRHDALS